jgi:hypothetical protein
VWLQPYSSSKSKHFVAQDTEDLDRVYCGVNKLNVRQQCVPLLAPFIEPVLAALRKDRKYRCTNSEELLAALNSRKKLRLIYLNAASKFAEHLWAK